MKTHSTLVPIESVPVERTDFPQLMTAKDLSKTGISRDAAYRLLNRTDLPVVVIGTRRFMNRDRFFEWLDEQAAN